MVIVFLPERDFRLLQELRRWSNREQAEAAVVCEVYHLEARGRGYSSRLNRTKKLRIRNCIRRSGSEGLGILT